MNPPRHFALIPAAGVGARMGASFPKQYLEVAGKPILRHVIDTFHAAPPIAHTFVVVSPEDGYIADLIRADDATASALTVVRNGGATRRESVLNGLQALRPHAEDHDWVLVHDAARPGLTVELIERLTAALADDPVGGLLALPVVDTLKRGTSEGRAEQTVSREGLWAAQTPQMFRYGLLQRALSLLDGAVVTDEAQAVERMGFQAKLVAGDITNFKVTYPQDIKLAELILGGKA